METAELGNASQIWLKGFAALMRRFFTEDTNGMQQSSVSRVVMKHFYLSLRCFVCDFFSFFFFLIFAGLQSTCIIRRWFRCECHNFKPANLLFFCFLLTNTCYLLTPVHCHVNGKLYSKDELQLAGWLVGWLVTFIVRIPPVIRLASKTPVS